MITYITKRILAIPVIMILVSLILFSIIMILPVEQRIQLYLPAGSPRTTPEQMEIIIQKQIERFGLDQPPSVQYIKWLKNMVEGDWGFSYAWQQPVREGFIQRIPPTFELLFFSLIPSIILALSLGARAARSQNRLIDQIIKSVSFISWAVPPFILGLLLMAVFYARLGWLPIGRVSLETSLNADSLNKITGILTLDALLNNDLKLFFESLRHLILPAVTLAVVQWALFVRVMRNAMIGVLKQDFITTARAKGVPEKWVLKNHARPIASIPMISIVGIAISLFINNVVVVESIFRINGLGQGVARAILFADMPVALGFALISSAVTITASLLADILYILIDPRIELA